MGRNFLINNMGHTLLGFSIDVWQHMQHRSIYVSHVYGFFIEQRASQHCEPKIIKSIPNWNITKPILSMVIWWIILKFCTEHSSKTAVLCKIFQNDSLIKIYIWANKIVQDAIWYKFWMGLQYWNSSQGATQWDVSLHLSVLWLGSAIYIK